MTLYDVWKLFCFFLFSEVGDQKIQLSWSLKGVNIEMTLVDGDQWKSLIVYCVQRQIEETAPLGWRDGTVWLLQLNFRTEKFVEYWRDPNFVNVFC